MSLQNHLNTCIEEINAMLPEYLKPLMEEPSSESEAPIPDSTSSPVLSPQTCPSPPPSLSFSAALSTPQKSPLPDLHCEEDLSNDSQLTEEFCNEDDDDGCCLSPDDVDVEKRRLAMSSSPLSATDIFSELDSDVLQVIFDATDSHFSILVS